MGLALFNVVGARIPLPEQEFNESCGICKSGLTCKNNVCKKKDGQSCSKNDDCAKQFCNECHDTCGKRSIDEKCCGDSTNCASGKCGTISYRCVSKNGKEFGYSCSKGSECLSRSCVSNYPRCA